MVAILVIGFVKPKQGLWTLLYLYVGALFYGLHISSFPTKCTKGNTLPTLIIQMSVCY